MANHHDHSQAAPALLPPALSERDLAELLGEFNQATQRLHSTHESLRAEVARLQGELRAANEQLERSRRLAALGEMAAGIAHEIRNPLGSIRLYAGMLEEDLLGRDAERALAQRIMGAVRTVNDVVQDVLTFAREFRIRAEEVEIDELFTRAIDESLLAVSGTFRIERNRTQPGCAAASCDPSLMHRALVNIICNALQAMQEASQRGHGEAVLTAGASMKNVSDPDGSHRRFIAITVTDTGPGVPADVLPRMFNPFVTTRASGTGLGLAIVHRIVDAHGGRVSVRNVESRGRITGASVELLLPAPVEPSMNTSDASPMVRTRSRKSITRQSTPPSVRKTARGREGAEGMTDSALASVMEDAR